MTAAEFQQQILHWFDRHGRRHLPWQQPITPYRVWISEIMLQQTQVLTVIPYFQAFMAKFPDVEALASAPLDEVLALWSGLGYYARARHLHQTAQLIRAQRSFPDNLEALLRLPGIGRSTAGAILSIAFKQRAPILDGNVKRVLARFKAVPGWPGTREVESRLWELSDQFTPVERVADYTQAIMDLGATICTRTRPRCELCPLAASCQAYLTGTVAKFPASRAVKPLPVKHCFMLFAENRVRQILLEKKPPAGIWGGLWSLPEFASESQVIGWCELRNLLILNIRTGDPARHTFSHYHLDFTPVFVETGDTAAQVSDNDRLFWHPVENIVSLGLPAPIKRLLLSKIKES